MYITKKTHTNKTTKTMKSIIAIATLGALSQAGVRSSGPLTGVRSSVPLTGNKHKYLQGLVEDAINEDGKSSSAVEAASNDGNDDRERTGIFGCISCKKNGILRANNEEEDGGRRLAESE